MELEQSYLEVEAGHIPLIHYSGESIHQAVRIMQELIQIWTKPQSPSPLLTPCQKPIFVQSVIAVMSRWV